MSPASRFGIRSPGILGGIVSDAVQLASKLPADIVQHPSEVLADVATFATAVVGDVLPGCHDGQGCRPCGEGNNDCTHTTHTVHSTTSPHPPRTSDPHTSMSSVNHDPSSSTSQPLPTSSTDFGSPSTSMSDGNNEASAPNYHPSQWPSVTLPRGSLPVTPTMRMESAAASSSSESVTTTLKGVSNPPTGNGPGTGDPLSTLDASFPTEAETATSWALPGLSTSTSASAPPTPSSSSSSSSSSRLSSGAIAGIVITVLAALILLGAGALWCRRRRRRVSWAMIADPYTDKYSVAETHYSFLSAWSVRSGGATSRSVTPTSITSITSLLAPTPPPVVEKRTRDPERESSASCPSPTSPTSPSSPTPFLPPSSHSSPADRDAEPECEHDTPVQHASTHEYSYGGGRPDVPLDVSSHVSLLSTSRGVPVGSPSRSQAGEALSVSTSLFPSETSSTTLSPGA
ncbi:hypothetical protein C8Q80DRAFT_1117823 [Daedaleopsis nitida]|nr:hypothetical protein C8Q80DRAFT_1117823 [Daedaleopsis nitida]